MSETKPELRRIKELKAASGRTIKLTCPVCSGSEFYTSGPEDEEHRKGFQHVILGVNRGQEATMYLPVKFAFCGDCGYVLKFMLPHDPDGG